MKLVNKLLLVASRIFEVIHWMIFGVGLLVFVACCFNTEHLVGSIEAYSFDLTFYGIDPSSIYGMWGEVEIILMFLFIIAGIITACLMALIFHNVACILKTISDKKENPSPFQKKIVKKVQTIGILLVALPATDLFFDIIRYFTSSASPRITIDFMGFMVGLVCVSLTQIFLYGAKLEEEVDGLL